jgi:hypothetical protein
MAIPSFTLPSEVVRPAVCAVSPPSLRDSRCIVLAMIVLAASGLAVPAVVIVAALVLTAILLRSA